VGNIVALILILRRRLQADFPVFFCYLAFHTADTVSAFLLYRHFGRASLPYFYEYWAAQAVGLSLRFGIIYEIIAHVLRNYEGLRRASRLIFGWAGALLLAAGIVIAVAGPQGGPIWARHHWVVAQRSIEVVQCGMLALLFLFASYFALTWRNYVFGIALGFGIIATIELLASALAAQSSPLLSGLLLNSLPRIAYDVAAIIWVAYLALPEPSRQEIKVLPQHDLEKWNRELLEMLQR
jgi:hypothetical protein